MPTFIFLKIRKVAKNAGVLKGYELSCSLYPDFELRLELLHSSPSLHTLFLEDEVRMRYAVRIAVAIKFTVMYRLGASVVDIAELLGP
jgi:hypothetical protein